MAPALGFQPSASSDIIERPPETATLTDASATATASSTPGGGGGNNNGLYLYTFMITLLVLFGVSIGVIARSCVLRRRFRRQMAAAVQAGVALPPRLAKREVVPSEKPVLFEVWMDHVHGSGEKEKELESIVPISATVLPKNVPNPDGSEPVVMTREFVSEYFGIDLRSTPEIIREFLRNSWANARSTVHTIWPTPSTLEAAASKPPPIPPTPPEPRKVAVGLVIAMPNSSHPHYNPSPPPPPAEPELEPTSPVLRGKRRADGGEELEHEYEGLDLPDIVLGLMEADWVAAVVDPPSQPRTTR